MLIRRLPAGLLAGPLLVGLLIGGAALAGCGNDDGADLRDLTEETAIPSRSAD